MKTARALLLAALAAAAQPGLPLARTDGTVGSMPDPGHVACIYSLRAGASGSGPFAIGSVIAAWR